MFRITVFNYLGSGLEILRSQISWTGQISCLGPKFQILVIGYFQSLSLVLDNICDIAESRCNFDWPSVDPALCPIACVQISSDPNLIPTPDTRHRLAPRRNQEYSWRGSDQWWSDGVMSRGRGQQRSPPGIFRQITGRYQASSGNLMWIDDF